MTKNNTSLKLHLSIVSELLAYYCKEKRWVSLPGLMIWALLPLSIAVFGVTVLGILCAVLI